MKRLLFLLITVFYCGGVWGQCPQGDITLNTQAEIDDFATNYPGCTELVGSLIIDSNVNIEPNVYIYIYDLSPLNVITSIGSDLTITNNPFVSLMSLNNITSVGGQLTIINNNSLNNLAGIENITIGGDITITDNAQLSSCNIQNVCDYIETGEPIVINSNASGCNSITEVNMACLPDCPVGNITFGSDWEVNNFLNNYPNCTELTGSVTVQPYSWDEYDGFWNLNFLSQITSIAGNLNILNNNYYAFISLGGLDNLTFVGGDLNIGGNPNLGGLGGLNNLTTVNGRLNINNNESLITLSALENLTTIGDLKITSNYGLSICSVPVICDYLANNGSYEISNNGVGCTAEEVSAFCTSTPDICPLGGIGVTSQSELINFASLYPNCTEIAGDLYINIDYVFEFATLYPLEQITSIEGDVTIIGVGVDALTGLSNLTSIGGDLKIDRTFVDNLNGLNNLTSINGNLIITDNYDLTTCNTVGICSHLENGGMATIDDNGAGCYSNSEVIQSCSLPVEISTPLQARLQNQTAALTWRTETETNNSGFEIQRSKDGIQWERIGWKAGQGNTSTPYSYTYIDEQPFSNISYYRFKQVDFDGNFTYSNVTSLEYNRTHANIYPNPVKDKLYISIDEQAIDDVLIFDTMGRQINAQVTDNTIDVALLPKGLYTVKVIIGGQYFYEKIVVQ